MKNIIIASITLIISLFCYIEQANAQYDEEKFYRVKISLDRVDILKELDLLGIAVDHVHIEGLEHSHNHKNFNNYDHQHTNGAITDLSGWELNKMLNNGYSFEILIEDMATFYEQRYLNEISMMSKSEILAASGAPLNFNLGSMGGFKTFAEAVASLDQMRSLYPQFVKEKESLGKSIENRDIWVVWLGTDWDENKPKALYTSLTHAREPNSMMAVIYYMWWLLENYETNETARFILDNRHLAFVPVLNPDGYEHNRMTNPNGGGMHRKNRRPVGSSNAGVDLNRNFGPFDFWNHPNGGSSDFTGSDVYRGTAPFSEPETAALRSLVEANSFRTAFNYHTFSNLLVYPYGALNRVTIDNHIFQGYAIEMTEFNGYVYGTDQETVGYNTRGNSDDYMYGYEFGNPRNRRNVIAYTPEVGSFSDGFWPVPSRIIPLSQENVHPNNLLALYAGPELRIPETMTPEPSISTLDVGTSNFLSFEFFEMYNYGRFDMKNAELILTSSSESVIISQESIPMPVIQADKTFNGSSDAFLIEFTPDAISGDDVFFELEFCVPWMRQNPIWSFTFSTEGVPTNGERNFDDIPIGVNLYQNYPNPFNPVTQIKYTLNRASDVQLEIFDITGRLVQQLVNERQTAGEYRVSFNASELGSGVYIYRLQSGEFILSRKMTVIK